MHELFRGIVVLPLCSAQRLMKNNDLLLSRFKAIFGDRLSKMFLKATFFRQFVGGETLEEVGLYLIRPQFSAFSSQVIKPHMLIPLKSLTFQA